MNYHVPMYIALALGVVLIGTAVVFAYRNQRDARDIPTWREIRVMLGRDLPPSESPPVDQEAA